MVRSGMSIPKSGWNVLKPVTEGADFQIESSSLPSILGGSSILKGVSGLLGNRVAVKKKTAIVIKIVFRMNLVKVIRRKRPVSLKIQQDFK